MAFHKWDEGIELSKGEAPRAEHAIYQAFPNSQTPMGRDPKDGLPRPAISHAMRDAQAPWMTPEIFVCMGDYSEFVIRDQEGTITDRFEPGEVRRLSANRWVIDVEETVGTVKLAGTRDVSPLRPACKYYARQMIPDPGDNDHRLTLRLCTARQSDEGQFLDLGNSLVYACELRSPSDLSTVALLDAADEKLVQLSRRKLAEERGEATFDLEKELAKGNGDTAGPAALSDPLFNS